MASAASSYCAQVNKNLTCPGSMKRSFLRQLRNEVDFYCEEHGKQEVQNLYAVFGTPEEVAEEFLTELSAKTVSNCTTKRHKILITALIVVVIAAMAVGALSLQSQAMQQKIDEEFIAAVTFKEDAENRPLWVAWQEIIFGHTDKIE